MPRIKDEDWDKAVKVARYLMLGNSREDVAGMLDIKVGKIRSWEGCELWSKVMNEAASDELENMAAKALGVINKKINEGDVVTARWYLDRAHPYLGKNSKKKLNGNTPKTAEASLEDLSDEELEKIAYEEEELSEEVIDAEYEELQEEINHG